MWNEGGGGKLASTRIFALYSLFHQPVINSRAMLTASTSQRQMFVRVS